MRIAIGADHAGFHYKERLKAFLEELGHEFHDFGTFSEVSVDYPSYIRPVAEAVARGDYDRGIVLGASGNGEAIVANRIPGIRCTLCWNAASALLARKHNDSNVLSMGARLISEEDALEIVRVWLTTPFDGGRHLRRINQIDRAGEVVRPQVKATPKRLKDEAKTAASDHTLSGPKEEEGYDVFISFRYIRYVEGERSLEFDLEPGLKRPTLIKVPSSERWRADFPPWARNRREEILGRLKSKCSHMNCELEEF